MEETMEEKTSMAAASKEALEAAYNVVKEINNLSSDDQGDYRIVCKLILKAISKINEIEKTKELTVYAREICATALFMVCVDGKIEDDFPPITRGGGYICSFASAIACLEREADLSASLDFLNILSDNIHSADRLLKLMDEE